MFQLLNSWLACVLYLGSFLFTSVVIPGTERLTLSSRDVVFDFMFFILSHQEQDPWGGSQFLNLCGHGRAHLHLPGQETFLHMPCTLLLSRSTSCLCPRFPKRMFLWRTAWEDSVPLQSKKQICLLSIMVKIASLLGQSSGRLAYHILYRIRFPKLGVSQLPCKPTACATFMWTSLSHLYRTWGAKENCVNMLSLMLLAVL